MKKSVFCVVLVLLLCFSSVSVFAQSPGQSGNTPPPPPAIQEADTEQPNPQIQARGLASFPSGDGNIPEERVRALEQAQYEEYLRNKDNLPQMLPAPSTAATRATPYWQYVTPFWYVGQMTTNECGVASMQMVVGNGWRGNSVPTRDAVKNAIGFDPNVGADPTSVTNALNRYNLGRTFEMQWYKDYTLFYTHLWNTIWSNYVPMLNVAFTTSDGFQYDTPGHYFTLYAVYSDNNYYAVADPWGGYLGNNSIKSYSKHTSVLFDVLKHGYIH